MNILALALLALGAVGVGSSEMLFLYCIDRYINLLAEVQSNRPTIVAVRRGAGAVLAPVRTRV